MLISPNSKTTSPRKKFLHQSIQKHRFPICVRYIMWLKLLYFSSYIWKTVFTPFFLAISLWIKGSLSRPHRRPIGGHTWPKACLKREIWFDFWVDTTLIQVTSDSTIATTATLHCMAGCKGWKWLLLLTPYDFKSYYCKSNKDVIFYSAVCNAAHDKCDYCTNFHYWLLLSLY